MRGSLLYHFARLLAVFGLFYVIPFIGMAQFDTEYWMPPVWESRNGGNVSPTELLITTAYPLANITVTQTDGTIIYQGTVNPGTPATVALSTTQGMTYQSGVVETDRGILIQADYPVQAVYRNTSHNNQCLAPLKGKYGLGTEFYTGSQTRVKETSVTGDDDLHFISVMATEDNSTISLTAPSGVVFRNNLNTVTITLDKHETYLITNPIGTNATNNLAGTHVQSDKPIAVMSGAQHLLYAGGFNADAGIDQPVPVTSDIYEIIGTQYIVVRGGTRDVGGTSTDYATIIGVYDNTDIYIDGSTIPVATINAGETYEYILPGGRLDIGTPHLIETSQKAYVYHVSGLKEHEVDMAAVPAIGCTGSTYLEFTRFEGNENHIHIIAPDIAFSTPESIKINDNSYMLYDALPETVPGNIGWKTISFTYDTTLENSIKVSSDVFFHLGIIVGGDPAGAYGYMSGFTEKVNFLDPSSGLPSTRYLVDSVPQGTSVDHCLAMQSCSDEYEIVSIVAGNNTGNAAIKGAIGQPMDTCLTYTAKSDYVGYDTVQVNVVNGTGVPGSVELIYFIETNPVANADSYSIDEENLLNENVLTNDASVADATVTLVDSTNYGSLTLNPDGTFQYNPEINYFGQDTFTYKVCDNLYTNNCSQAIVTISINNTQDLPVLSDSAVSGFEDQVISLDKPFFTNHFTDMDADTLQHIRIDRLPSHGSLKLQASLVSLNDQISVNDLHQLTFVPELNYSGTDSFGWNGFDGTEYATTGADIEITFTAVNDAPTTSDFSKNTLSGQIISFSSTDFTDHYLDVENTALNKIQVTTISSDGELSLDGNPVLLNQEVAIADLDKLVFAPNTGFSGTTSFAWKASDGDLYSNTSSEVSIVVISSNTPPVVSNVIVTTAEDQSLFFAAQNFTDHFSDSDGNLMEKIQITALPSTGALTLNSVTVNLHDEIMASEIANLSYTPPTHFNGNVTFQWNASDGIAYANASAEVLINITEVNDLPTISNISKSGIEEQTISFTTDDFTDQYTDEEGTPLSSIKISALSNEGTLMLSGAPVIVDQIIDAADLNTLTFVPNTDFNSTTSFEWKASDGQSFSTEVAQVQLSFTNAPDAPSLTTVTKDHYEDATTLFSATDFSDHFTDSDGDALQKIQILSLPAYGVLYLYSSIITINQEILYADLDHISFVPANDYFGTTNFQWNASDGSTYANTFSEVTLNIANVQDKPSVTNIYLASAENQELELTSEYFEGQYSDVDQDPLQQIKITALPSNGDLYLHNLAVSINDEIPFAALEDLTYSPVPDYNGTDTFRWNASDGLSYADSDAEVQITVNDQQNAPTITNFSIIGAEDMPVQFSYNDFANAFYDADAASLQKIRITSLPGSGTLFLDGQIVNTNDEIHRNDLGSLTFIPTDHYYGSLTFGWNASDGTEYAPESKSVEITLQPVQDIPKVTNIYKVIVEDHNLNFSLLDFSSQFYDPDDEILQTIKITSLPDKGVLSLNSLPVSINQVIEVDDLDQLQFSPTTDVNGVTNFSWSGSDGIDYSEQSGEVQITIDSANDQPVISTISQSGVEDKSLVFTQDDFTSHFIDADGQTLQKIQIKSLPDHGELLLDGQPVSINEEIVSSDLNLLIFLPYQDFYGNISFVWNGSDGQTYATEEAQVEISIQQIQDTPIIYSFTESTIAGHTLSFSRNIFEENYQDVDDDTLQSIKIISLPEQGELYLNGRLVSSGQDIAPDLLDQLIYISSPDFSGIVSFTWKAYDGYGYSASQDAKIEVQAQYLPVTLPFELSTDEDTPVSLPWYDFVTHYTDVDGDTLSHIVIHSLPATGILSLSGQPVTAGQKISWYQTGDLIYSPPINSNDTISFQWSASDGYHESPPALVTIRILPVDDSAPIAQDTIIQIAPSITTYQGNLSHYVTDPEGLGLMFNPTLTVAPDHGTVSIQPDGSFEYIPHSGFTGTDRFVYEVCDQGSPASCTSAEVQIVVLEDTSIQDADGDSISDAIEKGENPDQPQDTDADGIPDYLDEDSDNDGLSDKDEAGDDPENPRDSDNNGIPDFRQPNIQSTELTIYKGFSPDGDGFNDIWEIDGIESYPDNRVEIYNRWGNKIFSIEGYNNRDKAWGSEANVSFTFNGKKVPDGTYFYIIYLEKGKAPINGYVVVNR